MCPEIYQATVNITENENISPCLDIYSDIRGRRNWQNKKDVAQEFMEDHCIQEVLEKFLELMPCEVILEEETGFSMADKEGNTVVYTNRRIGKWQRLWKQQYLLGHSKVLRCNVRGREKLI